MEGWDRSFRQSIIVDACTWLSWVPDAVIANSEAGREYHLRLGYRPRRFLVVDNGIDTGIFRPDPVSRREVRAEFGISDAQPLVAMLARLDPVKDHETFLKAMDLLPEVEALMIGEGTTTLPARPGLHRLGERGDIPRLLAACDLVVSSSTSEGFPNAILEGMAAGLPTAATDAGDSRRIAGATGYVVPVGNAEALAKAIKLLVEESPEQHRVRQDAARRRIIEQFSLQRAVSNFDAVYRGEF